MHDPLREALAKCHEHKGRADDCGELARTVIAALQQAPAQAPVAYRHLQDDGWEYYDAPTGADCPNCEALYTYLP